MMGLAPLDVQDRNSHNNNLSQAEYPDPYPEVKYKGLWQVHIKRQLIDQLVQTILALLHLK